MPASETRIVRWHQAVDPLRQDALSAAIAAYFDALGDQENPQVSDLEAAARAAHQVLLKRVTSPDWIAAIGEAENLDEEWVAAVQLSFSSVEPELRLPAPHIDWYASPTRAAVATAVGAVCGTLTLTPLARALLGMRDVGLVVGGPLGASLAVFAVLNGSRNPLVRRLLMSALGVATLGEARRMIPTRWTFGGLWSRIGRQSTRVRRAFLYSGMIFLLIASRSQPHLDREEHRRLMRSVMDQWLDAAILALGVLMQSERSPAATTAGLENQLGEVASRILELRRVSPENLAAATDELLQCLKNMGVHVADSTESVFQWRPEHREQYDVFDHVESGDHVVIEREPVVVGGVVRQKGLLRKVRVRA